jgi:6-phosphogluconolactonase (cycloisomerase 2 family)
MQYPSRILSAALCSLSLLCGSAIAANAQPTTSSDSDGANHVVFVQTDDPTNNQVLAYHRADDGTLTRVGTYDTGGLGGKLQGAAVDPLASQGSLEYDRAYDLLIGVNAGSNSVYAFHVDGDRLSDRQVADSDGLFPVSVASHDNLVYVLNAEGAGAVKGFRVDGGHLHSLEGSIRSLGLTPVTGTTQFVNTPGQVSFTPNGSQLIVTTKNNGSDIDVFGVHADGRLTATPVRNPSATPVPFGITFDAHDQLVIAEAGTSDVSTYLVRPDGTLATRASVSDAQAALCWITPAQDSFFGANAGSGTVTGFKIDASGHPTVVGNTTVGAGPIDLAASQTGQFLYVQLGGAGSVAELKVNSDGSLTSLGTITGHTGMEGIVAQ